MTKTESELHPALISESDRATAMKLIYETYIRHLTAVCSRYIVNDEDVKDVLHDCFLKIFASFDNFKYRGEGSLKAWMTKIVINETLKFIKQTSRIDYSPISDDLENICSDDPDVEQIPASVIHSLIRELPDGYRLIFNLYVIEGKSHREIADMLGIKENTSASQLHRAKALLAEKINKYHNANHPV